MLQIHRTKPLLRIGRKRVPLTPTEHRLVITLAMLDNKVAPHAVLLDALCEDRVQIPADRDALSQHLCRLRKKLGPEFVQVKKQIGYQLTGDVRFVG